MTTTLDRIHKLTRKRGTLRASELSAHGIARVQLTRLVAAGELERVARGVYALPTHAPGEHVALTTVAQRTPDAVFCLLTALRFHNLTTQAPFEVWIAIANKAHLPRLAWPKLCVVRFSGAALTTGIATRMVDGVPLRITDVAKTVADCFKFRNKIGLDVALEALREAVTKRRASVDEIWRAATVCRVTTVMRPYLDSL